MFEKIASFIPEFMNALYNDDALKSTSLEEIRDAFRKKQIQGKAALLHLVETFCKKDKEIVVIGSWIGFTSFCLYKLGYSKITEVDPDTRLTPIAIWANRFNKDFAHITDDVNNLNLDAFNVIINTSCEHIEDNSWFDNIPKGTLMFLQSTDYESWDHTNTCSSLDEMIEKYPMNILHAEELYLEQYSRYILVGIKS